MHVHIAALLPSPSHMLESYEVNNKNENQLLQKAAAIPWFHRSQSLNISFIILACSHHPCPVSSIFLHFLLLLSSKKVEPLYHLLFTTWAADLRVDLLFSIMSCTIFLISMQNLSWRKALDNFDSGRFG